VTTAPAGLVTTQTQLAVSFAQTDSKSCVGEFQQLLEKLEPRPSGSGGSRSDPKTDAAEPIKKKKDADENTAIPVGLFLPPIESQPLVPQSIPNGSGMNEQIVVQGRSSGELMSSIPGVASSGVIAPPVVSSTPDKPTVPAEHLPSSLFSAPVIRTQEPEKTVETARAVMSSTSDSPNEQQDLALRVTVQPSGVIAEIKPNQPRENSPAIPALPATGVARATVEDKLQSDRPEKDTSADFLSKSEGKSNPIELLIRDAQPSALPAPERTMISTPQLQTQEPEKIAATLRPAASTASNVPKRPQDLAFAARVQPADTVAASTPNNPRENPTVTPVLAPSGVAKATLEEKLRANRPGGDELTHTQPEIAVVPQAAPARSEVEANPTAPQVHDAQPVALHAPERPANPAPLKEISLQVGHTTDQKVDVRLVSRAGELHVAVHTGDSTLAHGLREGLPQVVGRLSESGFHTETWHPGSPTAGITATPEARHTSADSQPGNSHGHHGSTPQDGGRRDQNQSNRPQWVGELEASLAGETKGEPYGISS